MVESASDAWEDLTAVADNTVYPENVLIASGIASVNSLAFAGALPANDKPEVSSGEFGKGNYLTLYVFLIMTRSKMPN